MTEADVCRVYITPAIKRAGWNNAFDKRAVYLYCGKDNRCEEK